MILRTIGKTKSNVGKAIIQEIAHADIHTYRENSSNPKLRNVLIIETTKVIMIDKRKGKTIEV
ncbi:hypothetical protein ANICBIBUN_05710 [Acinetobacter nosocomialis 28F]|uniref:Uncharacterized protein n=1 Tax=Acinetobacter nosocomialis 28F TaxID=1147131 RepID=A0AA36KEK3_ACINO|nr:hypothetical protein APD42_02775 [Acinetobacter nosocomialis]CDG76931.1 hypothetical protein ANICBIBUN_05710 [Acinetobacter nosocomialis 28F]